MPAAAFGFLPLLVLGLMIASALEPRNMADFHVFRQSGVDVLAGRSPYPPVDRLAIADADNLVYPPPVAFLAVPFALLSYATAAKIYVLLVIAAALATLRVLGVRDPRCYGVMFLSAGVLAVLGSGSLTAFLALGVAVAWRYRDRTRIAAPVLAAVVIAKIFLWPLLVWLVVTRRTRSAVLSAALAVAVSAAAWAAIGFAGLREYPDLLRMLADVWQGRSYSPVALGLAVGLPVEAAQALALGLGAAALGLVALLAQREDGERLALTAAVGASLLLSPIVWLHYFALLLVPVALARPRLSGLWLLPLAFWAVPMHSDGITWRIAFALALTFLVLGLALARPGAFRFAEHRAEAGSPALP